MAKEIKTDFTTGVKAQLQRGSCVVSIILHRNICPSPEGSWICGSFLLLSKAFWFSENGMLFLLSSPPFPQSMMQFSVTALQGKLLMILQTWRNLLLTFPHPSGPGREMVGFFWPSVCSCKAPKDLCCTMSKKAGLHRTWLSHLKIVAYAELRLFKISEEYLSPLTVCIYTRMDELLPKRACSSSVDSKGSLASQCSCLYCRGLKSIETSFVPECPSTSAFSVTVLHRHYAQHVLHISVILLWHPWLCLTRIQVLSVQHTEVSAFQGYPCS